jgi:single-strand DNA-binding protein
MTARAARRQGEEVGSAAPVNEVRLRGRLAAAPVPRDLPSGDEVVVFRVVVDRPPAASSVRVDTIDCAAFRADVRRSARRWAPGDVLEVRGRLRRRFFRSPAGPASRYEVEVESASRVARAAGATRATMAG